MITQETDIILLESTKQLTITYPYDSYLESMYATIEFDSIADTCKCGYIAKWEVKDNILYLNGFDAIFQ